MNVGIDKIAFYTSNFKVDLEELAKANHLADNYYAEQLGQLEMAAIPPYEDWVTLGANALRLMLTPNETDLTKSKAMWQETLKDVGLLLFATESAAEMSKASASYLHEWFQLPSTCRILELKQACYSATGGLQLALDWLRQHQDKAALIIASDIARYKVHSSAESSQGGGAIAMLLKANPSLITLNPSSAVSTKQCLDFWHPNALPYALVDGKLSCEVYLKLLASCWQELAKAGQHFSDFKHFAYHSPVPKLVYAAHRRMAKLNKVAFNEAVLAPMLSYTQRVGNCYTASLYLNLLSLLENQPAIQAGDAIAMYSYGSGSIGEVLTGYINEAGANCHKAASTAKRLAARKLVSLKQHYAWQQKADERERALTWEMAASYINEAAFHLLNISNATRTYGFNLKPL